MTKFSSKEIAASKKKAALEVNPKTYCTEFWDFHLQNGQVFATSKNGGLVERVNFFDTIDDTEEISSAVGVREYNATTGKSYETFSGKRAIIDFISRIA